MVSYTNSAQNTQFLSTLVSQIKTRLLESNTLSSFIPANQFNVSAGRFFFRDGRLPSAFCSLVSLSLEVDEAYRFLFPSVPDGTHNRAGSSFIIVPGADGNFYFGTPTTAITKYSAPYFLISQNFAKTTVLVDQNALSCVAILDAPNSGGNGRFEIVERFEHSFRVAQNSILSFRIEDKNGSLIMCDSNSFFMIKLFQ